MQPDDDWPLTVEDRWGSLGISAAIARVAERNRARHGYDSTGSVPVIAIGRLRGSCVAQRKGRPRGGLRRPGTEPERLSRPRTRPSGYPAAAQAAGCRSRRSRALRRILDSPDRVRADRCRRTWDQTASPGWPAGPVGAFRALRVQRRHPVPCVPPTVVQTFVQGQGGRRPHVPRMVAWPGAASGHPDPVSTGRPVAGGAAEAHRRTVGRGSGDRTAPPCW